jgi:two-component system, chemotaxis family, protein-glutamate methylesterase/glutaminase
MAGAVPRPGYRVVVIGASAGGLHALRAVLSALPADFPIPIAVIQHRSRDSELLCELLQNDTPLRVLEVLDKEEMRPGSVYVAPPDYHLLVEEGFFSLSVDAPVRFSRPSIDVTFESAADSYGMDVIGVVLTGANADGAAGLARIVAGGGYAVVQDPATAEVAVMPRAARAAVPAARVLPLDEIGPHLARIRSRAVPAEVEHRL